MKSTAPCPCRALEDQTRSYGECCQPWHLGRADCSALPPTAEQLMRSRYCAFVLELGEYLLDTWHPDTRPADVEFDKTVNWTGLEILATRAGGAQATRGVVHFVAHYRSAGREDSQEERSTFIREDGLWFYLDAL
ncbi:YchJ family metal-binding protein [Glutamicibacter sp. PS]|uniref:YchJ family protein n=1 Tax=Glutamicibacter sp. PS TaxID=3075634 RepID=UPI00283E25A8|nr:YchJ family metal-binding protein [Glutamicibacter sp. PS]MDR4533999.1 YchJ family metal-binding protein [Glutamicibacter sp. PS]